MILAAILWGLLAGAAPPPQTATSLEAGQIWHYQARKGEEASTLTILKVETVKDVGEVVHVAIEGIHIRNPYVEGGVVTRFPHAVYTPAAIRKSVTTLAGKTPVPPAMPPAYARWKAQAEMGQTGAWGGTVAETLDAFQSHLDRAPPPPGKPQSRPATRPAEKKGGKP